MFFLCDAHPRLLHSFPTRRSSDLTFRYALRTPVKISIHRLRMRNSRRSEEHTSELQSHHDLVCRLLLEKKNKRLFASTMQRRIATTGSGSSCSPLTYHQPTSSLTH